MSEIHIDDGGNQARFEKLAVFMRDLRPFWPLVVPLVTGWWREQFATEGAFAGDRWAQLSPQYAIRKGLAHPGKGILEATGDMRRAASMPLRSQTPQSLTLTIDSDVLPYHQEGTSKMPQRLLVFGDPLPAGARVELQAVAERYMTDLTRRLGF